MIAGERQSVASVSSPGPDGGRNRRASVVRAEDSRFRRPGAGHRGTPRDASAGRSTIREVPPAERPRERLAARGAAGLSAAELIALVWGSGSAGRSAVDLADDALARHDGLTGLARATDVELEAVPGIGAAKAAQLTAAFELGRRLLADWPAARWTVRSPRDVADRLVLQMGRLEREELRVVLLNTKTSCPRCDRLPRQRVDVARQSRRTLPRRRPTQRRGRDPRPQPPVGRPDAVPGRPASHGGSARDGRLLDIDLLDHLVVGHDAWASLRDRGVAFDRAGLSRPDPS